ncbi:uncharacterized protein LOC142235647 [Haematobia irritans]|uniref:uncharacterized protein LOC142235647 n=1 Tax=Haematobia irritans TaxID=7368 RepID=UPI003F5001FD
MYADDVKLFSSISTTVDSCRLQGDLDLVVRWCDINGMCLNFGKCKKMTFFRSNALLTEYYIDNVKLEDVQIFNDLGVLFDRRLKFDSHVESIVSRAMSTLGFIKRWSREFNDPYLSKHLPTLERRRLVFDVIFISRLLKGEINSQQLISKLDINVPSSVTRQYIPLKLPVVRNNYEEHSSFYRLCRHYNEFSNLPDLLFPDCCLTNSYNLMDSNVPVTSLHFCSRLLQSRYYANVHQAAAIKYLSGPPTRVISEYLSSAAGRIFSQQR